MKNQTSVTLLIENLSNSISFASSRGFESLAVMMQGLFICHHHCHAPVMF